MSLRAECGIRSRTAGYLIFSMHEMGLDSGPTGVGVGLATPKSVSSASLWSIERQWETVLRPPEYTGLGLHQSPK